MNTARVENFEGEKVTVKVGDYVGFKSDIEQSGKIKKIERSAFGGTQLVLENENGFHGDYIGGETITVELATDCWVD
jgi:hypothetical protein